MGERILTLKETAELFDMDEAYVRERAASGTFPCYVIAGEVLFSKTALERWVLGLRVTMNPYVGD
jgi:hypothetical protein